MVALGFFQTSLGFLIQKQKYECMDRDEKWERCEESKFCERDGVRWRVNYGEEGNIHNWIEQYNLYCEP